MVQIDGSTMKRVGGARVVLIPLERETLKYAGRIQFPAAINKAKYEALSNRAKPIESSRGKESHRSS